jgi:hypothetical protein
MKLIDEAKSLAAKAENSFLQPRAIYGWLGGRHFVLCEFFALTAFYLELHGKLTPNYAATITAICGFATWRSTSEDRHDERKHENQP